ncbi:MAG TPA: MFS transporter [Stellaceae bacterium]|nr:MFS transporter [Stellaceae bacterium]
MAILLFIVFLDLLGFGVMIPLLPFYGKHFGASPTAITWMMASYSLAQFFSSPILGRVSDKIGRRPVLLISLACSVTAYLWLGFADAFWMLVAARLLAGAGAGNIAAAQAYITDVTSPEKRAKGMGLIGAAFGVGFTLGPPIGGMIAGSGNTLAALARPAFLSAGLSAIAFVLVLMLLKESLPPEARHAPTRPSRWQVARHIAHRPTLRLLILLLFTTVVAFAAMEVTQALWLNSAFGWDQWDVGLLFLFVGIVLIIVQGFLIGPLSRRFGGPRLVTFGAGAIMVGLGGMPFALKLPVLLFMCGSLAVGMGLLNPSINALISREAGVEERGGILGVAQSGASLARIIGPFAAGPLFTLLGRDAPYYAGGAVMLIVLAMALRIPRGAPESALAQSTETVS